jgi:hypothetical protein
MITYIVSWNKNYCSNISVDKTKCAEAIFTIFNQTAHITSWSLAHLMWKTLHRYRRFGGTCCLHLRGSRGSTLLNWICMLQIMDKHTKKQYKNECDACGCNWCQVSICQAVKIWKRLFLARFEALTAVLMKIQALWEITSCRLVNTFSWL